MQASVSIQPAAAAMVAAIPFRVQPARLEEQLAEFNQRREVQWFGFEGRFEAPSSALIHLPNVDAGLLGGGGTDALNGGVIAAGVDAACVLAAMAQYDEGVVMTLRLELQFMRLAYPVHGLQFRAQVLKAARHFCFVQAVLVAVGAEAQAPLASATAMLAPGEVIPTTHW
jgi:acyl-coenzyme A thioesterase PaaI-like protein